ncbi:prolyl 4-hydroxylase [Aulographum hederae CBS 113979]|uniref:Prolyl 4-hydroxylase n=1 Tax=Aulographum hederae CBS 113979 TaxID=1176131 RepID=A0A6G1GJG7_9PEZI|nr:prolyl 4-hydroxylase [Aulographum hederae CBS 113979]
MSKSKAAKRKRDNGNTQAAARKKFQPPSCSMSNPSELTAASKSLSTLVSQEELEITVDTLRTLIESPAVIKSKACKELRTAVYDFKQACTTGVNAAGDTSLTGRISAALTDAKYVDALVLLAEMRVRGETPKLGTLCRWVRDVDVVSGLAMQQDGVSHPHAPTPRSSQELELLRLLDAILRVTGPTDRCSVNSLLSTDPVALQQVWNLKDESKPTIRVRESVLDGSIFEEASSAIKDRFKILESTPGPRRKPPNIHPAVLYLSDDNAVSLRSSDPPSLTLHKHPVVPSLSMIRNLLSPEECRTIIAATESVGFLPDVPLRDVETDESPVSTLSHNVYWIIDQPFHDALWDRVRPFVPELVRGRKVCGINRRFRVYRYVPGAVYRCHIDGAWPPSGVSRVPPSLESPNGLKYHYDASPSDRKQSSLFTFLMYLNDDFDGGETTFFLPSVRDGVMNAYPVKPVIGGVVLFPHGEAAGALLHEGTGVKNGAKYIIRTDVEYDSEPSEEQQL